jgi:hypothetical protein
MWSVFEQLLLPREPVMALRALTAAGAYSSA